MALRGGGSFRKKSAERLRGLAVPEIETTVAQSRLRTRFQRIQDRGFSLKWCRDTAMRHVTQLPLPICPHQHPHGAAVAWMGPGERPGCKTEPRPACFPISTPLRNRTSIFLTNGNQVASRAAARTAHCEPSTSATLAVPYSQASSTSILFPAPALASLAASAAAGSRLTPAAASRRPVPPLRRRRAPRPHRPPSPPSAPPRPRRDSHRQRERARPPASPSPPVASASRAGSSRRGAERDAGGERAGGVGGGLAAGGRRHG